MAESAEKLQKQMKQTAGSRFIAAKRLARHDRELNRLIAFSSVYIILLTVLPFFLELSKFTTDLLNLGTVGLSLILLVSSLMQYSNGESVNAEQQHRSGLEINEVRRELELKEATATPAELVEFARRYGSVLQKYSVNHEDIDYLQYQFERPEEFNWLGKGQRTMIKLRLIIKGQAPTILLIIVTLLVAITIFAACSSLF